MPDETMQGTSHYRLVRLDDLEGYRIAKGEPDPRGWNVRASDGRTVGRVDSLIADTEAMKIRYLDVALDTDALRLRSERHVLIPIGGATLEKEEDVVELSTLSSGTIAQLPSYRHQTITREDEQALLRKFDGRYAPVPSADFYSHQHFSDQHFFSRRLRRHDGAAYLTRSEEQLAVETRPVKAGEVDIKKRVETEHVRQAVPVVRDEVTVDRRPAATDVRATPSIGENEVRIPLLEEEVLVEKRVVPKEELVITKHQQRDTKTVDADLRKERVDIETRGNARIDEGR